MKGCLRTSPVTKESLNHKLLPFSALLCFALARELLCSLKVHTISIAGSFATMVSRDSRTLVVNTEESHTGEFSVWPP